MGGPRDGLGSGPQPCKITSGYRFTYKYWYMYEGQSKITEPYLITFESSKMDIYLDDISLQLYVIHLFT